MPLGSISYIRDFLRRRHEIQFNLRDQIAFREFLAAELVNTGIFNAFTEPDGKPVPIYHVDVAFHRTLYSSASSSYELDVLMNIRSGDEVLHSKDYLLKDKMTFSNMMWQGDPAITKNRIAKTLLTQIIEDIDAWASGVDTQAKLTDGVL